METSPTDPKLRPRYYYADRHPFYFGNALNMARHNAYMILNELFEQFGRDKNANPVTEESLAEAAPGFYKKLPAADLQGRFAEALAAHFPFLACPETLPDPAQPDLPPPAAPRGQEVVDRLALALRTLHELRNAYSHAHHPAPAEPPAPVQYLFDYGAEVLLPRRFGQFQPENLLHLRNRESANFKYHLHDAATGRYTEKGLAFFICLFLERRYAFRFLSRLEGLKYTNAEWARATLQCFALYCCRLPRPRLESSDILLDMLNDLGRCPDRLYHCLSENDRKRFDFSAVATEPVLSDSEHSVPDTGTPMKRYDARFPYFALRYFDDTRAFERLRFQINLASLVVKRYPKTIDGMERERMLLEPLRVFGRWRDFTAAKMPPHWKTGTTAEKVWQFAPHYNLDGANIPLKIVQDPARTNFPRLEKLKAEQPDAILSAHELHNLFLYQHLHRKGWIEKCPEDYILDYRRRFRQLLDDVQSGRLKPAVLPPDYSPARVGKYKKPERERLPQHIAFLERSLTRETDPKRRSQKENDLRKSQKRLAELERYDARKAALAPEIFGKYGIRLQDLPDAVREHLMGFQQMSLKDKAEEKIIAHLKDTEKRLADLSKHRWGKLKVGDVATWIARDLLLYKPHQPDGKGMPNSDEYSTLQAKIAYFPVHRATLPAFFADQGLTGRDAFVHPFLHKVNLSRCNSVLDFYKAYLTERQRWLHEVQEAIHPPRQKNVKPLPEAEIRSRYGYFLHINTKPLHLKNYTADAPLYLPKGFFNPPILAAMRQNGYPVDPAKDNAVYALALLVDGDTQGFYTEYTRFAHVRDEREWVEKDVYLAEVKAEIERLSRTKKRNDNDEAAYREFKSEENRIYEREQAIRLAQSTDRALWLMAQERAGTRFNDLSARNFSEFRLRDVGFDRLAAAENETGKNVLDLSVPVELPYRIAGQDREVIITDTLPIKRHGDFRRFLKDRRIEDLLEYLSADRAKISRPELEVEIETYDQQREAFFERIYRFEEAVFERFGAGFPPLSEEKTCYNHFDYLKVIEQNAPTGIFDPLGLEKTCELRNKLCHNEIPSAANFSALIDPDDSKQIAERLFELANRTYDTIMEKLQIKLQIETHTDELA